MRHFAATLIEEFDEWFYTAAETIRSAENTADKLDHLRKWLEYTHTLLEQYVREQAGGNE